MCAVRLPLGGTYIHKVLCRNHSIMKYVVIVLKTYNMRKNYSKLLTMLLAVSIAILAGCSKDDNEQEGPKLDVVFTALTSTGSLQTYNANNLSSAQNSKNITGLQAGEMILGIDYRPATGQLYGLGSTSRIYVIDMNGVATAVGTAAFSPALSGNVAGFDFNPTVDRIRVVTSTGQNLRLNPETGAVQATDGSINGVSGAIISSVAYTNSMAGATSTVLFDIDASSNKLYKQDPPNDGKLVEVGNLGLSTSGTDSSFDISASGIAIASVNSGTSSVLYQVNLENGSTTKLGTFPAMIMGLAIPSK